jgi:hypothetical protein
VEKGFSNVQTALREPNLLLPVPSDIESAANYARDMPRDHLPVRLLLYAHPIMPINHDRNQPKTISTVQSAPRKSSRLNPTIEITESTTTSKSSAPNTKTFTQPARRSARLNPAQPQSSLQNPQQTEVEVEVQQNTNTNEQSFFPSHSTASTPPPEDCIPAAPTRVHRWQRKFFDTPTGHHRSNSFSNLQ